MFWRAGDEGSPACGVIFSGVYLLANEGVMHEVCEVMDIGIVDMPI